MMLEFPFKVKRWVGDKDLTVVTHKQVVGTVVDTFDREQWAKLWNGSRCSIKFLQRKLFFLTLLMLFQLEEQQPCLRSPVLHVTLACCRHANTTTCSWFGLSPPYFEALNGYFEPFHLWGAKMTKIQWWPQFQCIQHTMSGQKGGTSEKSWATWQRGRSSLHPLQCAANWIQ